MPLVMNRPEDFVTVVEVEESKKLKTGDEFVTVVSVGDDGKTSGILVENVSIYRLPGERLGMALKFEGGISATQPIDRVFVQNVNEGGPASKVRGQVLGSLLEGDEIVEIQGMPVSGMTRINCVNCLREAPVCITITVKRNLSKQQNGHSPVMNGSSTNELSNGQHNPILRSKKEKGPPPPIPPRLSTTTLSSVNNNNVANNDNKMAMTLNKREAGSKVTSGRMTSNGPSRPKRTPPPLPARRPKDPPPSAPVASNRSSVSAGDSTRKPQSSPLSVASQETRVEKTKSGNNKNDCSKSQSTLDLERKSVRGVSTCETTSDSTQGVNNNINNRLKNELHPHQSSVATDHLLCNDLFAVPDSERSGPYVESESDDTGSSVSTVIERFPESGGVSGLVRTNSLTNGRETGCRTPTIDIEAVLGPFERLEKELDNKEALQRFMDDTAAAMKGVNNNLFTNNTYECHFPENECNLQQPSSSSPDKRKLKGKPSTNNHNNHPRYSANETSSSSQAVNSNCNSSAKVVTESLPKKTTLKSSGNNNTKYNKNENEASSSSSSPASSSSNNTNSTPTSTSCPRIRHGILKKASSTSSGINVQANNFLNNKNLLMKHPSTQSSETPLKNSQNRSSLSSHTKAIIVYNSSNNQHINNSSLIPRLDFVKNSSPPSVPVLPPRKYHSTGNLAFGLSDCEVKRSLIPRPVHQKVVTFAPNLIQVLPDIKVSEDDDDNNDDSEGEGRDEVEQEEEQVVDENKEGLNHVSCGSTDSNHHTSLEVRDIQSVVDKDSSLPLPASDERQEEPLLLETIEVTSEDKSDHQHVITSENNDDDQEVITSENNKEPQQEVIITKESNDDHHHEQPSFSSSTSSAEKSVSPEIEEKAVKEDETEMDSPVVENDFPLTSVRERIALFQKLSEQNFHQSLRDSRNHSIHTPLQSSTWSTSTHHLRSSSLSRKNVLSEKTASLSCLPSTTNDTSIRVKNNSSNTVKPYADSILQPSYKRFTSYDPLIRTTSNGCLPRLASPLPSKPPSVSLSSSSDVLTNIIQNRRQNSTKLKGLIIPDQTPTLQSVRDLTRKVLPIIMSSEMVLNKTEDLLSKQTTVRDSPLPSTPSSSSLSSISSGREFKSVSSSLFQSFDVLKNTIPKYSPAFKRRALEVSKPSSSATTSSATHFPSSSSTSNNNHDDHLSRINSLPLGSRNFSLKFNEEIREDQHHLENQSPGVSSNESNTNDCLHIETKFSPSLSSCSSSVDLLHSTSSNSSSHSDDSGLMVDASSHSSSTCSSSSYSSSSFVNKLLPPTEAVVASSTSSSSIFSWSTNQTSISSLATAGIDNNTAVDDRVYKTLSISLKKDGAGLGFILEGGKDSPLGDRPLIIKKIFKGGLADKEGTLMTGDEILSVNEKSVANMTRTEAWYFLKKLPDLPVNLVVRRVDYGY